jgi:hypothetical protein
MILKFWAVKERVEFVPKISDLSINALDFSFQRRERVLELLGNIVEGCASFHFVAVAGYIFVVIDRSFQVG